MVWFGVWFLSDYLFYTFWLNAWSKCIMSDVKRNIWLAVKEHLIVACLATSVKEHLTDYVLVACLATSSKATSVS